jgi:hypothetical protein
VDLEVGPSLVFLHGTLIRHFMHVKENIFGEDQRYTPMDQQEQEGGAAPADPLEKKKEGAAGGGTVDLRQYRPLNVILDITVHDLQVRWKDIESDFCLAVLGIRNILVRIRIPGSVPVTNGSGSGSGSLIHIFFLITNPQAHYVQFLKPNADETTHKKKSKTYLINVS